MKKWEMKKENDKPEVRTRASVLRYILHFSFFIGDVSHRPGPPAQSQPHDPLQQRFVGDAAAFG
jgi:hypothetical protein